jgi:CheY-like chemotaxis protein
MTSFSAMYFPTTTIFIDDEISFLNQLTAAIDGDHHKICQDFGATATYVKHIPQVHSMRDINALACNPKKHEFVSTIVVDYQMEPRNGLDLCKAIKDSPASKIMLTGIASKDKAIEAHNAELIDFFVSKRDPRFLEKLNEAIIMGTRKYFARLSKRISGFYSFDNPLANPIVAAYLENELKEAVSYHTWIDFNRLTAVTGSKKQVDYMISSEEDFIAILDSAEANDAPEEVITTLKDRTYMLWYEHTLPPGKEWKSYISSCTKINNSNFYLSKGCFWNLPPKRELPLGSK